MKNYQKGSMVPFFIFIIAIILIGIGFYLYGNSTPAVEKRESYKTEAQIKATDAYIRSSMMQLRPEAELYYDRGSSYAGFCGGSDQRISTIIKNIKEKAGDEFKCTDSQKSYAVSVKLAEKGYWCIDSTGFMTGYPSNVTALHTGTACTR